MDSSIVLTANIDDLCAGVSLGAGSIIDPLRALSHDLHLLTRSYLGLELVLAHEDRTVTLTSFGPMVKFEDISSSLHLPLVILALTVGPGSTLTLYAAAPGAFTDLAADLTHALGSVPESRLDQDLAPYQTSAGLADLDDVFTLNREFGWLIDRGCELEDAPGELAHGAATSGSGVLDYATELVRT